MATTTYNFTITQGTSFSTQVTVKNSSSVAIDLTNYSARGHVKYRYTDASPVMTLTPVISDPSNGVVIVSGSGAATASLAPNQYVYDVEVYDSGNYVLKILKGFFNLYPEVTS